MVIKPLQNTSKAITVSRCYSQSKTPRNTCYYYYYGTISWPLYKRTCINQHPVKNCWSKVCGSCGS